MAGRVFTDTVGFIYLSASLRRYTHAPIYHGFRGRGLIEDFFDKGLKEHWNKFELVRIAPRTGNY